MSSLPNYDNWKLDNGEDDAQSKRRDYDSDCAHFVNSELVGGAWLQSEESFDDEASFAFAIDYHDTLWLPRPYDIHDLANEVRAYAERLLAACDEVDKSYVKEGKPSC